MWRTIGVSLISYLFVVCLYALLSYFFDLDRKIEFLIKEVFNSSAGIDVIKFFILNIISILLSDNFIRKFQPKENKVEHWRGLFDEINNKFNDLQGLHEELIHYVTIIMNDYSSMACIIDFAAKYDVETKVDSHIEKLKSYIPEEDIESIEKSYKNLLYVSNLAQKDAGNIYN